MPARAATITVGSRLAAPPDRVWAHARTMAGVNAELRPLVRMTVPAAARGLTLDDAPLGTRALRSVLLAGGVLPFDRHDLTLVEVDAGGPPFRFLERSSSLLQRLWEHERTVAADGDGTLLTDRVAVTPRLPGSARLTGALVGALFRHRHRRARRLLGAPGATSPDPGR
jgi:ligand-binding SRPBCC domain-containing protein